MSELDESNPTRKEINEAFSRFLGGEINEIGGNGFTQDAHSVDFTVSLDALVPVWKKLSEYGYRITLDQLHRGPSVELVIAIPSYTGEEFFKKGTTIQMAAAISTHRAVKALEDRMNK